MYLNESAGVNESSKYNKSITKFFPVEQIGKF